MSKSEVSLYEFPNFVQEFRENLTVELTGILLLVAGGIFFFSLHSQDSAAWLTRMTGWTAPLVAASFLLVGLVLLLGRRAGYWSAEALVGAELFILSLQAGTFVWNNASFSWSLHADGTYGGLFGWTIGGLLLLGLGRWVAFALISLAGLSGGLLLLRYTPLIYVVAYTVRLMPVVHAIVLRLSGYGYATEPEDHNMAADAIYTRNFVAPGQSDEDDQPWFPLIEGAGDLSKVDGNRRAGKRAKSMRQTGALPPLDLLSVDAGVYGSTDVRMVERAIEETLSDFNVPVRVVHVESGPTVTQFGVEPLYLERSGQRRKVRVNRIVNLADDLALALAAPSVRIEAPVPGRPYVGIEVPNTEKTLVSIRGILESDEMRQHSVGLLMPLGRDTSGAPVIMDLTRAPHLLIAGATGSGKSVCINTIVTGLLMQHGPERLQFVMVDPKMVELPGYNGIPHLLGKVITDVEQVMGALTWLLLQMDDRYRLFQAAGVRNIDAYNELARKRRKGGQAEPLPYIVLIIDELADLMMTAAEDVERQICRLAQLARATGIHLILATQRPSTDVVTGLIKANFPSRIAFAVTSQIDSRVILDTPGAERLLGRGDMLLLRPDLAKLARLQGCYVADEEINHVVAFWKSQTNGSGQPTVPPWNGLLDRMDEEDELLLDAIDILREMQTCSTSMLQRKLRVGYPKAARLMEELEAKGVVGPDLGGGQGREVLLEDEVDEEELDEDDDMGEELYEKEIL